MEYEKEPSSKAENEKIQFRMIGNTSDVILQSYHAPARTGEDGQYQYEDHVRNTRIIPINATFET